MLSCGLLCIKVVETMGRMVVHDYQPDQIACATLKLKIMKDSSKVTRHCRTRFSVRDTTSQLTNCFRPTVIDRLLYRLILHEKKSKNKKMSARLLLSVIAPMRGRRPIDEDHAV